MLEVNGNLLKFKNLFFYREFYLIVIIIISELLYKLNPNNMVKKILSKNHGLRGHADGFPLKF